MPELDPTILEFYRDRYREDERLTASAQGRLELLRTRELLLRHLPPPPARVLDVGGGPGVHARWLASEGYDVHLVDPVPTHVEAAGALGGFTAALGDARALEAQDASSDAVLLLGPLYHLVDPAERILALREAARATRPGGLVAAAAISRYAGLLKLAVQGRLDEAEAEVYAGVLRTGRLPDQLPFTAAYLHHADELAAELRAAGLRDVAVLGIEGPSATALLDAAPPEAEALLSSALLCARTVETDPALLAASPHLMGIGRVSAAAAR